MVCQSSHLIVNVGPRDLIGNGDAGVLVRNGNVKDWLMKL